MSDFDQRAQEWDTPERQDRARALAGVIRASVALDPAMRVIDIGAGTGLLGLELAGSVGEMVLAEPSAGMLEVARAKLASGAWPNATAIAFDLASDPPPGDPFDLAVSLLVLHHLADTPAALAAIHAMLAPGGRIALIDLDAEDGTFHDPDAPGIHHQGFDRAHIVGLAAATGFDDLGTITADEIERDGRSYPLFLLTGRKV
jgi:ubiquinone/menaquinone biosynthesis C-methylase UbiE